MYKAEMKKGSPEGYNAETGLIEPAQKPQTGEPSERKPLYRIRRTQENHQLLRQVNKKGCARQNASGWWRFASIKLARGKRIGQDGFRLSP